LLVTGDNITTDHIMPAGAEVLPFRSNVPALSDYVFTRVDPTFPARRAERAAALSWAAKITGKGRARACCVGAMYLGVKAVWSRALPAFTWPTGQFRYSPLVFVNAADYDVCIKAMFCGLRGV
jgi:aconitate hydratase